MTTMGAGLRVRIELAGMDDFEFALFRAAHAARRAYIRGLPPAERAREVRRTRYIRRKLGEVHSRSSRYRAGSRANRRHRTVPTFASDRRPR